MSERQNGQLARAKRTIRSRISSERWEQIKTAYAAGIGLREIARKMNIPEGTVLAHAKRHGWTQQIQVATRELSVMQSDAITPVQSVPSIDRFYTERTLRSN
jgi:DNA-binding NarL/FixJ family response regulator